MELVATRTSCKRRLAASVWPLSRRSDSCLPQIVRDHIPARGRPLRRFSVGQDITRQNSLPLPAHFFRRRPNQQAGRVKLVTAALRNGRGLDDPLVRKGLQALEGLVKPDGGIYGGGRLKNYETCVAMLAFAEANGDGRYQAILQKANQFLKSLQTGDGTIAPDDPWYGGVGYGGAGRPDLSNTAYFIEALRSAEVGADNPAIQKAIAFLSRCQNLEGQGNDTAYADLIKDGGFYYEVPREAPVAGEANERSTANGGPRSYGSMSYSGLKSMIYAGLTPDDPRVTATLKWVKANYSVDENPGMGSAGLYYYYHTFSSALKASGLAEVTDQDGKTHDWRADLINELASRQNPDGSWPQK